LKNNKQQKKVENKNRRILNYTFDQIKIFCKEPRAEIMEEEIALKRISRDVGIKL
jgi:hypothetical protein